MRAEGKNFTEFTDASMPPQTMLYNAYYHNWQTLNFTASDSSLDKRCFLKLLQLMQLAGSKFQSPVTLFKIAYFLAIKLRKGAIQHTHFSYRGAAYAIFGYPSCV